MSEQIARQWLKQVSDTAGARDHAAHMDLISTRVSLQGVPGFDNITYDAWNAQCKHEFENNLIQSVRYDGFKLVAETPTRIMFKTLETVEAIDGTTNAQGVEMLLEQEDDGKWRLVQERVLPSDESRHDGLIQ